MGAGQFLLPYLGAQPRSLLNRIVASGAAGMNRRDADDWALSRLIELGYVEESPVDDTAFVCTPAGRHRWQMEILADEERDAIVLRRQLIRQRVDERFSRLGINRSTALTTAYSPTEPRLWSSPPQTKMRWSSVLATVFAAAAAALLVISTNAQPREVLDWPFQPTLHAAVVRADQPKANVEQTALVAAPAAASVAVPWIYLSRKPPDVLRFRPMWHRPVRSELPPFIRPSRMPAFPTAPSRRLKVLAARDPRLLMQLRPMVGPS